MVNKENLYKIFKENFNNLLSIIEKNSKEIKNLNLEKDDIEYLHKTRVSLRRLRVLTKMYYEAFNVEDENELIKKIKKIGNVLGKAREIDVQIKLLENISTEIKKESYLRNIYTILVYLKNKRNKKQKKVLNRIKKLALIKNLVDKIQSIDYNRLKIDFIKRTVMRKIEKFFILVQDIYKFEDVEKLHKVRIVAKTIRYQLEVLGAFYKNEFIEKSIEVFHKIQNFLGDIHDLDVLNDTLKCLGKKRGHIKETIKVLQGKITFLRKEKYEKLMSFWNNFENREIIFKLSNTIQCSVFIFAK